MRIADPKAMTDHLANTFGGDGLDWIEGGDGNDTIDSGANDDWIVGGAGMDTFAFADGSGVDTIEDFNVGVDKIAVGSEFNISFGDAQVFDQIVQNTANGVMIVFDDNDRVELIGVDKSDLTWDDFVAA